jgi:hypothetical protein
VCIITGSIAAVNLVSIVAMDAEVLGKATANGLRTVLMAAWLTFLIQGHLAGWSAHHVLAATVGATKGIV